MAKRKQKKMLVDCLTSGQKYALVAIYGQNWHQMNNAALCEALKQVGYTAK